MPELMSSCYDQMCWKEAVVRNIFLSIDAELVLKIKPSRRVSDDILARQPENSGIFSVRSAYKLALNEHPEQCMFPASSTRADGQDPCWPLIWKSSVPPKVKVFAWKAARNTIFLSTG
jgi:hypothetical protein